jgi:hypothetical protein
MGGEVCGSRGERAAGPRGHWPGGP